ncbi:MAG: TdeIII family type II restriction endonuclease [Dehalococcoidales bacterium]
MSLSANTKAKVAELLTTKILEKLRDYQSETHYMPFHHRLFGKDRYAMFSFMQSMNTTFGMSIWEQVAVILVQGRGAYAERQHKLLGEIDNTTEEYIRGIHYKLRECSINPNIKEQTEDIRLRIKPGQAKPDPDSIVDLFISTKQEENYFDITSVKPNIKEFVALKLKLLRWIALRFSQDRNPKVFTRLAIPYNPYHPDTYARFTLKGLYDLNSGEVLVGEEFWNFVAADNIYNDLLDVFQEVGEQLRSEIDKKFTEFRNT